jgi:predicted flap endonuclease-1-like 5' DNA nuclease
MGGSVSRITLINIFNLKIFIFVMANVHEIEGIGPVFAEKLSAANVKTTDALLKQGGTKAGREKIADATGISETHILRWVNMADLFRIKGVGEEYSDLLEAAGVDTVKELATRRPDNLHAKMEEVNAETKLVRQLPSLAKVEAWVAEAKGLEPMVSH